MLYDMTHNRSVGWSAFKVLAHVLGKSPRERAELVRMVEQTEREENASYGR